MLAQTTWADSAGYLRGADSKPRCLGPPLEVMDGGISVEGAWPNSHRNHGAHCHGIRVAAVNVGISQPLFDTGTCCLFSSRKQRKLCFLSFLSDTGNDVQSINIMSPCNEEKDLPIARTITGTGTGNAVGGSPDYSRYVLFHNTPFPSAPHISSRPPSSSSLMASLSTRL